MIDKICYEYNYYKPRMYRQKARRDYLYLAKCKKRTAKKIHKAVKKQLQYVKGDLDYIEMFLETGDVELTDKQISHMRTIHEVFEQQEYMYKTGTHSVKDRIVSISQPYICSIVHEKAKAPVEVGARLDMSIGENGIARLERISFDAYNEADVLINAIENYQQRAGHYPERVLVDKIYRNQTNRINCKGNGIRISGLALGRPKKMTPEERE